MKKQTISVVIAVKNEEKNIKRCLDSVQWADEIIIVDNGSTDKTVNICRKYNCRIYSYPYKVLIPQIQNQGIKKTTKDWILILDADVEVPEVTGREILEKIQSNSYSGYYIYHKCYFFGKFVPWEANNVMKLFRRNKGGFFKSDFAHCPIKIDGRIGQIKNPVLHHSHPDINTFIKKINLYSSQDSKIIFKRRKGGLLGRKITKVNLLTLLVEPILFTFYVYFFQKLYRSRMHGFVLSVLLGYYLFIERAKVWELEFKSRSKLTDL